VTRSSNGAPTRRIWREAVAVAIFSIALGFLFTYPLMTSLTVASGFRDWDYFEASAWVPYVALRHFRQFPLWNPYKCGGLPAFGNPQSRIVTPFLLLHLMVGPLVGLYLEVPLHFAIAWAGGYVLARVLGIGRIGAFGAATAFPASSWYALHATAGHAQVLSFAWMPWVLALTLLAARLRALHYCALAGAALALTFFESQGYSTAYTLLVMATVMPAIALTQRSKWPLVTSGVTLALGAGLIAIKLLPAVDFMRAHPRPMYLESNSYRLLSQILFSRNQDFQLRPGYWEFGAYIGIFVVPAVVGAISVIDATPWMITALLVLLIWRGAPGGLWPWALLHHLPVFSSMRLPSRAVIPFTLSVGVLAGFGLERMKNRIRYGHAIAIALIVVAALDCLIVGTPNYRYVVSDPESEVRNLPDGGFHQVFQVIPNHEFKYALHDSGAISCYEPVQWQTSVKGYDQDGYLGEQYMVGAGNVRPKRWSPTELAYEVDTSAPSDLVINQNYDRAWRVVEGTGKVFEFPGSTPNIRHEANLPGLLAVHVAAGSQHIRLCYRPKSFVAGAAISLSTLLICIGIWLVPRHHSGFGRFR